MCIFRFRLGRRIIAGAIFQCGLGIAWMFGETPFAEPVHFVNSAINFGDSVAFGRAVALGDVDMDGDLDAWVAATNGPPSSTSIVRRHQLWLNDGKARFRLSSQKFDPSEGDDIELVDVDLDRDLDALVTGGLYTNNGKGFFTRAPDGFGVPTVEWEPSSARQFVVGDLNGDSIPDLLTIVDEPTLWLNDGSGKFANSGSLALDRLGRTVLIDLDGDGDQDLLSRGVAAFNDGTGQFTISTNPRVSWSDIAKVSDFNGDDRPDILTRRRVCLNQFPDPFQVAQSFEPWLHKFRVGDLDNDGDEDIASHIIWLNNGDGTFEKMDHGIGDRQSFQLELGDLDNDGDLDAWVVARPRYPHQIWLNDGNGQFAKSVEEVGVHSVGSTLVGDLDGDADMDVWVNYVYHAVQWINHGNGNFIGTNRDTPKAWLLADFDGDADLDALVDASESDEIWLNDGQGQFEKSTILLDDSVWAVADFNRDTLPDLLMRNYNVRLNNGRSTFMPSGRLLPSGVTPVERPVFADVDNDGDIDAAIRDSSASPFTLWTRESGSFELRPTGRLFPRNSLFDLGSDLVFGDVDSDGDVDAAVSYNYEAYSVWLNDGAGMFENSETIIGRNATDGLTFADVDGDGDMDAWVRYDEHWWDLAGVGGVYGGLADYVLWLNNGPGQFLETSVRTGQRRGQDIAVADFNGDSHLDVWVTGDGTAQLWLNGVPSALHSIELDAKGEVVIEFIGILQSADQVDGDYRPISGRSPYRTLTSGKAEFFHAR